jgi:hypothetical protein
MTDAELLAYSLPFLRRMFPEFDPEWISRHYVWRARHAQPVVTRGYGKLIPAVDTPLKGFHIATMAQITRRTGGPITLFARAVQRRVA